MPEPSRRTRGKKCHQIKSSGGLTLIHYGSKKTSVPRCSSCGQVLAGIPRQGSSKLSKLTGTQRRIERMYSGNLCHSYLRILLRQAARIFDTEWWLSDYEKS